MPKWKMIEKLAFLFEVFISSSALWDAREELSAQENIEFLIYDVLYAQCLTHQLNRDRRPNTAHIELSKAWDKYQEREREEDRKTPKEWDNKRNFFDLI